MHVGGNKLVFFVVTCAPFNRSNGRITYGGGGPAVGGRWRPRVDAILHCDPGYSREGIYFANCRSSGMWSNTLATCAGNKSIFYSGIEINQT